MRDAAAIRRLSELLPTSPRLSRAAPIPILAVAIGFLLAGVLLAAAPAHAAQAQAAALDDGAAAPGNGSAPAAATEAPSDVPAGHGRAPLLDAVEAPPLSVQQGEPDFRFQPVKGWLAIRGGYNVARADSDIYTFNEEQLTLQASDFNSMLFGMDFGWALTPRVELVFGFEYLSTSPVSEFRDWVDEFGAPITQQTRLRQAPLYASLRFNLMERGRAVGSYAWVPATVVPYAGFGGGFTWWRYEQFGDFVDYVDFTIFSEHFLTEGWAPSFNVFGGIDTSLTPNIGLMFEGKYAWADDELAPAFAGFEPIDLTGFRFSVGVNFRF